VGRIAVRNTEWGKLAFVVGNQRLPAGPQDRKGDDIAVRYRYDLFSGILPAGTLDKILNPINDFSRLFVLLTRSRVNIPMKGIDFFCGRPSNGVATSRSKLEICNRRCGLNLINYPILNSPREGIRSHHRRIRPIRMPLAGKIHRNACRTPVGRSGCGIYSRIFCELLQVVQRFNTLLQ
jgi:hypothetical protein